MLRSQLQKSLGFGVQGKASPPGNASLLIVRRDQLKVDDIRFGGTVQVDGAIEADVYCERLVVTASGRVDGAVSARTVHMDGIVNGPIDASRVFLGPTAVVKGNIIYEALSIATGASITGICRDRGRHGIRPFDGAMPHCPPPLAFQFVRSAGRKIALHDLPTAPALARGPTSMRAVWEARRQAANANGWRSSEAPNDAISPRPRVSHVMALFKMQRGTN